MESALIIRQQDTQQKGQTQMRQEGSLQNRRHKWYREQGSFEDTVLKAVVAKAVKDGERRSGSGSFDVKTDWVTCVKDIMQSAYRYGDLKGYLEWKKFLGLLEK